MFIFDSYPNDKETGTIMNRIHKKIFLLNNRNRIFKYTI